MAALGICICKTEMFLFLFLYTNVLYKGSVVLLAIVGMVRSSRLFGMPVGTRSPRLESAFAIFPEKYLINMHMHIWYIFQSHCGIYKM